MGKGPEGLTETELSSEEVYRGKLLKIRRDRVRLPDGSESVREYLHHPGAVVIVAVQPDRRLVFERQYRYPLRRVFLEMPAGKIDPGEAIEVCARRELREETGFSAKNWRHLGVMHPCIGYTDERIEIFLATGLEQGDRDLDPGEFLEVVSLSIEEVEAAIHDGRITDGKSVTAFVRALPFIR